MYSRPPNKDLRVPHNYGGSIFDRRAPQSTPVQDLTRKRQNSSLHSQEHTSDDLSYPDDPIIDSNEAPIEKQETNVCQTVEKQDGSILSPFGALGTEELLLISLALIIFQSEKEPELALILLALLFIN